MNISFISVICFIFLESLHAAFTEINGSYPKTSSPSEAAAFATSAPIAPSPITPSFFPFISPPAKFFFPFSTSFAIVSESLMLLVHSIPPTTSLAAKSIPQITSSFTPFAFAPGVLNTTIPASAHRSRGILFTPAPALAIARRFSEKSMSPIAADLTIIASASSILSVSL